LFPGFGDVEPARHEAELDIIQNRFPREKAVVLENQDMIRIRTGYGLSVNEDGSGRGLIKSGH